MVISESVTVAKDTFRINADEISEVPVILIQGENIVVDFQGAVLQGSNDKIFPDELYGLGIKIQGKNITIKNLNLQGYKLGLLASEVNGLNIQNSNISYNFRCRNNTNTKDLRKCSSPLSPENKNNIIKWEAGIEIKNCQNVELSENNISHNNYGIVIRSTRNGKIYNNSITHNRDQGVVMFDCDSLKIVHNFLDWNKNLGINCSSNDFTNIIAYNSMTHCGHNVFYKNIGFANNHFPKEWKNNHLDSLQKIYPPLKNGQIIDSLSTPYQGEKYILNDDWGLYDFQYPTIWLREINDDKYTFAIFGPEGNWKIVNGNGFVQTSRQSGSTPATIVATKAKNAAELLSLDLEFIGVEFTDQFGKRNPRGKTYRFGFKNL